MAEKSKAKTAPAAPVEPVAVEVPAPVAPVAAPVAPTVIVQQKSSSGLPTCLIIGCGCLGLLLLGGVGLAVAGGFAFKSFGIPLLQNIIEQKTGIKTNLNDLGKNAFTYTDKESGSTVSIGSGKVPDNFPKDFPVYPDAKVTSALSGGQQGQPDGNWVSWETGDSADKIVSFYKSQLKENSWTITSNFAAEGTTTMAVSKGNLSGTVAISRSSGDKMTTIAVLLSTESNNQE